MNSTRWPSRILVISAVEALNTVYSTPKRMAVSLGIVWEGSTSLQKGIPESYCTDALVRRLSHMCLESRSWDPILISRTSSETCMATGLLRQSSQRWRHVLTSTRRAQRLRLLQKLFACTVSITCCELRQTCLTLCLSMTRLSSDPVRG